MPGLVQGEAEKSEIRKRSLVARTSAVWLGFSLLIVLTLLGNVYSYFSVLRLEQEDVRARSEFQSRDQLLDQLANDVYRASAVARDYLLESDERRAGTRRTDLETIRARIFNALATYESNSPSYERANLATLHQSVDYFLSLVEPPLQWTGEQRKRESDSYLANTLLPNSERVEKLVRDITVRDEREVEESERRLQAGYLGLQKQMVFVSLSALLGGVAAAFLSARRITRLQREAEFRYEQVEQSRKQLENLSSQLVAAQEEERRKLSRELHDQLGQTMSALVTELGRLEHDSGAIPAEVRERAGAARKIAEENVRSIRDTALLLRPSMLDDLGLVPALRWQAREIRRNSSLKVRVLADEAGDDLPDAYKTCIYRVAQEALRNCVQHAKATEARVVLQYTAEGLSVSVQDDGVGFDPNGDTGVGILGMEERVSRLGGTLKIESSRGRGTILSMLFPDLRRSIPVPDSSSKSEARI